MNIDSKKLIASQDAGDVYPTSWGVGGLQVRKADWTSSGAAVTDAPASGHYLVITDINLTATAAVILHLFTDGAASPFWSEDCAGGGVQRTWRGRFKVPTVDKKVVVQGSAAVAAGVLLGYHSEG